MSHFFFSAPLFPALDPSDTDQERRRRLQILTSDGEWKHVPYVADSIVVNVRRAVLSNPGAPLLTSFKSPYNRPTDRRYPLFRDGGLAQIDHPSRDQATRGPGSRASTRRELSFSFFGGLDSIHLDSGRNLLTLTNHATTTRQLFYFSRAAHDWPTGIVAPSPVLERLGLYKAEEQPKEPVSGLGELFFGPTLLSRPLSR